MSVLPSSPSGLYIQKHWNKFRMECSVCRLSPQILKEEYNVASCFRRLESSFSSGICLRILESILCILIYLQSRGYITFPHFFSFPLIIPYQCEGVTQNRSVSLHGLASCFLLKIRCRNTDVSVLRDFLKTAYNNYMIFLPASPPHNF
jgi:hypothetical protein